MAAMGTMASGPSTVPDGSRPMSDHDDGAADRFSPGTAHSQCQRRCAPRAQRHGPHHHERGNGEPQPAPTRPRRNEAQDRHQRGSTKMGEAAPSRTTEMLPAAILAIDRVRQCADRLAINKGRTT